MKFGYQLFKIQYISPDEIEFVEKECANLENIWNLK
jgi:hypothetical protein